MLFSSMYFCWCCWQCLTSIGESLAQLGEFLIILNKLCCVEMLYYAHPSQKVSNFKSC